jgi:uncharacterized damage-inducible protein DinB
MGCFRSEISEIRLIEKEELTMSPQPAKMSPQQARGIAEYLLADLQQEIPTTVRVMEAAPVDRLDYAPDPKSKNALALIRHIVVDDVWFLNSIADGVFVGGTNDQSDACGIMTPADGAAKYKELVPAALARVRALPGAKLAEDMDLFGMMQLPAVALLGMMVKHSVHHRGQLSTYLRAMGGKVPGIYGPSGDSQ